MSKLYFIIKLYSSNENEKPIIIFLKTKIIVTAKSTSSKEGKKTRSVFLFSFLTSIHFAYHVVVFCSYEDSNLELLIPHPTPLPFEPDLKCYYYLLNVFRNERYLVKIILLY